MPLTPHELQPIAIYYETTNSLKHAPRYKRKRTAHSPPVSRKCPDLDTFARLAPSTRLVRGLAESFASGPCGSRKMM